MKEMKLFQLKQSATKGFSPWYFQPPKTLPELLVPEQHPIQNKTRLLQATS
jgi:hypothetical protein